jgi:PmbA protein
MKSLLEEAVARGADATLVATESRNASVSFEANRLKRVGSTESLNLDMQVIKAGKLGIASSTKPGTEMQLLENALDVAQFGSDVSYSFPEPEPPASPKVYDQAVADVDVDRMISIGEELIEFIKALDPAIQGSASVSARVIRKSIYNTRGLDASLDKTLFTVSAGFQFVEGQNLLQSWDWNASTDLEYDLETMKATLKADFDIGRKNVEVKPGVYDVLLTPVGFQALISPILACLDGRAVMRGISPFKDRIGEEIFAPSFSLIDDGTMDGGLSSRLYDDQGVVCRRTPLIEKGVLREYLLDLESAHRLGRRPIGTGSPGGANPNNLLVIPGETGWEELLRGMKKGIVIDHTMGAWAGNPYTGTVTGNIALGYLVEDGEKVGRVKDCMFSLNVFTHLKSNLLALSRDVKDLGGLLLPYCLIGGVSIASRES